jgi:type II secretory pathway pseudopilin PulG
MRSTTPERGFTLVEVSIILVVVSVLTAAIAPVLSGSVARARVDAASAEMLSISYALRTMMEDLGCHCVPQRGVGWHRRDRNVVEAPSIAAPRTPPPQDLLPAAARESGCTPSSLCDAPPVELLVTVGDIPSIGPEGDERWTQWFNGTSVDYLEYYLVSNTPGGNASRAFPTPTDCGSFSTSVNAWRGAYLTLPDRGDPWGNRYAINTQYLGSGEIADVVILSAGPDEEIDSSFETDGFVPGDDDIVLVFSAGGRY